MKHKILLLILCISLISIASASAPSIGDYEIYEDIELKQTCVINGTFCDSCNISSVDYPNGTILISDIGMTKRAGDFNYTLDGSYTDASGTYRVNGFCDYGDDVRKNWVYNFRVSKLRGELSTSESITYIIVFIIGFIVFIGLLIMGIYLPGSNKRDEMTGYIIAVRNIKYLKLVCLGFAYIISLTISYFAYTLSYAYLDFQFLTSLFKFLFYFEAIATLPLFILFTYLTISNLIRDSQVKDLLLRGLRVK